MSVSVRSHISKTALQTSQNFLCALYVAWCPDSFFFWWRCDTLCTSGFVDRVTFSRNERCGSLCVFISGEMLSTIALLSVYIHVQRIQQSDDLVNIQEINYVAFK